MTSAFTPPAPSVCYYHRDDLDGKCSAAIVKLKYPECKLIPMSYDDPPDIVLSHLSTDVLDEVFMVDFKLQPDEVMQTLYEKSRLTWIDHHKTSQIWKKTAWKPIPSHPHSFIIDTSRAACEIVWAYLFEPPLPRVVKLIGDWDSWRDPRDPIVRRLMLGLNAASPFPENQELWTNLLQEHSRLDGASFDDIIRDGDAILRDNDRRHAAMIRTGIHTTFEGYRCFAVNIIGESSILFEKLSEPVDIGITYCRKRGRWVVSLYALANNIDVSEIAKKYGGGGHIGAAGFTCDDPIPPFKI